MIGCLHRFTLALLIVVAFVMATTVPTRAQFKIGDVELFQFLLIWTGDYNGIVDGIAGPGTETAIRAFLQREFGRVPTSWTDAHTDRLVDRAASAMDASGFRVQRDHNLDLTFAVPEALMSPIAASGALKRSFESPDGELDLEVSNFDRRFASLDELYRRLSGISGREVTYSSVRPTWFVLTGNDADRMFYVRYHLQDGEIRGFSMSYPRWRAASLNPVVIAMSNVFQPTAATRAALVEFLDDLQAKTDAPPPRHGTPPAVSGAPAEGPGAEISVETIALDNDELTVIAVGGELQFGDEKRFATVALAASEAFVVFNSPGGSVYAGIEIGKAIRLKGFATAVFDGSTCASACALAWLAGTPRFMASDRSVGFHAAFDLFDEQLSPNAPANAVVGAYLNQLGLTTRAVIYMTETPPDEMRWLSFEEADAIGLETKHLVEAPEAEFQPPGQRAE